MTINALLLAVALTADPSLPTTPDEVWQAAAIDLSTVQPKDRPYIRYVSLWPWPASSQPSLHSALSFWCNSLSWNPKAIIPQQVPGGLWRIDLRNYYWEHKAWESVAKFDPYFLVSQKGHDGKLIRGWIDPTVEAALRYDTGSSKPILRADWFLARTSLDGDKGFFQGFYSQILGLPKTQQELLAILYAEEKLKLPKSEEFNKLFLLTGGSVLRSQVAQHNRGLELLPTLVGPSGSKFIWRSLDVDSDAAASSIVENGNLGGKIKVAGQEFIFSLPNGLHGYYIANAVGKRVAEVPTNIAQHKGHAFDSTVRTGYSCVDCHGPNAGINGFDDVIRRLQVGRKTGVVVISKGYTDKEFQQFLEVYYGSNLANDTAAHRAVYKYVVLQLTDQTPDQNAKNYLRWVEGYLWGRVTLETAVAESGYGEQTETYLKLTSPGALVPLTAGESIARELFEANYSRLLTARIYPWEGKLNVIVAPEPEPFRVPVGAVVLDVPPGYPAGAVRFQHAGQDHLVYRDGRRFTLVRGEWVRSSR